jgi:hypothetical protein
MVILAFAPHGYVQQGGRQLSFRRESCEDVAKGLAALNQVNSRSGRIALATAERPKASDSYNGVAGSRAGHSLLRLQREYGNRYVQRVLALSRQAKDETESSSGVRSQGESKKALGQLLDLKEALQTPGKPARGFHGLVTQTSPLQVSRQGLLTGAEETAAINFSRRYDERSVRIIQIITETNVDGNFGHLTAEAVAGFQNAHGLAGVYCGLDGIILK